MIQQQPRLDPAFALLLFVLTTGCGGKDRAPAPQLPLDLPIVGTVGDEPTRDERITIQVTREGHIRVPGRDDSMGLFDLRAWLREQTSRPEARAPDGSSLRTVFLQIDKDTPWRGVQWLLMTCAHPDTRIWKIAFAAETPGGERGAIGVALPRDGKAPLYEEDPPYHRIKLFQRDAQHTRQPVRDLDELAAALDALPKDTTGIGAVFDLVTPPPSGGRVPYGTVLRIVNASLAAGARFVSFEGAPMPRAGADGRDLLANAEALAAMLVELKTLDGITHVRLGDAPEMIPYAAGTTAPRGRGRIDGRWGTSFDAWPAFEDVEILEEVEEAADDDGK